MAVIVGKIVSGSALREAAPSEAQPVHKSEREIEYLTDPVPVRRHKFGFGAVIVIQLLLSVAFGVFIWLAGEHGGEAGALAGELVRRLLNG